MLDPRALLMFHRVCEAGSISAAARALSISQPSVSTAIATLEARLGVVLFRRTRGGIVLTPEGELLRLRAGMLHSIASAAEAELANLKRSVRGPLRVGGTPGALVSLLPPAVHALDGEGAPAGLGLELNVIERTDQALNELLLAGEIELAFVTTEIESPPAGLVETTLSRDPFTLVVGRGHDALPDRVSLRDLVDLPWVLPEAQGAFRRQVDALFVANGLAAPRDVVRCDSLLTTKAIVRGGGRVTILPREVAASELSIGVLRAIPIVEAAFPRCVGVRRHAERTLSPLAVRLLDALAHP